MPAHGFARTLPWQVPDKPFQTPGEIELRLLYREDTLDFYPFKFEVLLHYIVHGNTLEIRQTCINCGDEAMPFYSGFHPYFAVGDKEKLKFDIDAQSYLDYTTDKIKAFNGQIDYSDEVDFVFQLKQTLPYICRMTDPDRRTIVEVQVSREFGTMVLWTETGKDFVCIEPWMAAPDAMNSGKGLKLLPAGEELQTWVKILIDTY